MRFLCLTTIAAMFSSASWASDGAWLAFKRSNELSAAYSQTSLTADKVDVLFVKPDKIVSGMVLGHKIRVETFRFDCAARTFSILARKLYKPDGSLAADETAIAKAFTGMAHPVLEPEQSAMLDLVCKKRAPSPTRPFADLPAVIGWMTQ